MSIYLSKIAVYPQLYGDAIKENTSIVLTLTHGFTAKLAACRSVGMTGLSVWLQNLENACNEYFIVNENFNCIVGIEVRGGFFKLYKNVPPSLIPPKLVFPFKTLIPFFGTKFLKALILTKFVKLGVKGDTTPKSYFPL